MPGVSNRTPPPGGFLFVGRAVYPRPGASVKASVRSLFPSPRSPVPPLPRPLQERRPPRRPALGEPLESGHEAGLSTVGLADLGREHMPLLAPPLPDQEFPGLFEVTER